MRAPEVEKVDVGIGETGERRTSAEIHHFGPRGKRVPHVSFGSNGGNDAADRAQRRGATAVRKNERAVEEQATVYH
jgi:hypothetical protein